MSLSLVLRDTSAWTDHIGLLEVEKSHLGINYVNIIDGMLLKTGYV